MDQIEKRIVDLGNQFKGRLEDWRVDFAVDYVRHSEPSLAFETICDNLCDYNVSITESEFEEIMSIHNNTPFKLHPLVVTLLPKLIRL